MMRLPSWRQCHLKQPAGANPLGSFLSTSDLARAVGVHANTVRRYVEWGLLPPVERSPAGYRRFTQRHLDCLRVARMIFDGAYPGKAIRASAGKMIECMVAGDLGGALETAYRHQAFVQAEQAQANAALALLERWAQGNSADASRAALHIGDVARLLGVSNDILRNWERNGLVDIPRQPENGYRLYGPEEISRLRVIRMLVRAGYSLMAILRMLVQLDSGLTAGLRQALDTPQVDEDVYMASDRWLTTLVNEDKRAQELIRVIEELIRSGNE
jgi:DNA-binding transcriptional MerR regulator